MTGSDICAALKNEMGALFTCTAQGDYYRIGTPYLYPDGDNIDLFCRWDGDTVTVTDLAETVGWLRMQSIATRRSPNQDRLIADVCITHGVEFQRGMLQARWRPDEDLASVCNRVAQAALRVSDLWFTLRYRAGGAGISVANEVEEYLAERRLEYERAKKLAGRSLQVWDIDFQVRAAARSSLVYVLNTGSRAAAGRITDHVVAAWHDLNHYAVGPEPMQFVSLFDDTIDVWQAEDFRRVETLSRVARWSRPDEFISVLADAV